jgi:hypothetical protein
LTAWSIRRRERAFAIVGALAAVAALLLAFLGPRAALTGWLCAAAIVEGLPIGALILLLTMRLVAGKWVEDLRGPAQLLGALWPVAALAFVPVLAGMAAIYPWFGAPPHSPFAGVWLDPVFFVVRTVAWFVLGWWVATRAAGEIGQGFAAGMLIALTIWGSFVASDWLMTLDADFASSAFGLQVIALDACAALAVMVLLRLAAGGPRHTGVVGALMITLLLMWAYFQFMPFLIVWSGNLPDSVGWYTSRSTAGWEAVIAVASLLGGVPLLALFAPQVRKNSRRLGWCAVAVLVGKVLEFAWLTLPGRGWLAVVAWLVALVGLGCLAMTGLLRAARTAEAKA